MHFLNILKSKHLKAAGCMSLFPWVKNKWERRESGTAVLTICQSFESKHQSKLHDSLPHRYNQLEICKVCVVLCFAVQLYQQGSQIVWDSSRRERHLLAVHSLCQWTVQTQCTHGFQHPGSPVQPTLQIDQENLHKMEDMKKKHVHFSAVRWINVLI